MAVSSHGNIAGMIFKLSWLVYVLELATTVDAIEIKSQDIPTVGRFLNAWLNVCVSEGKKGNCIFNNCVLRIDYTRTYVHTYVYA